VNMRGWVFHTPLIYNEVAFVGIVLSKKSSIQMGRTEPTECIGAISGRKVRAEHPQVEVYG